MKMSLEYTELSSYMSRQASSLFPDVDEVQLLNIEAVVRRAGSRLEASFAEIDIKYYRDEEGRSVFSHRNSDQYATLIYLCSREAFALGENDLAETFYLMNKALHALDVYVGVDLPTPFFFSHPVGTVLGRAEYGQGFFVHQGCSVGGNRGHYPIIGEGVTMYAGSALIGRCRIGDRCRIGAGVTLVDVDVPDNSTVVSQGGYEVALWSGRYRSHPIERYRVNPSTTDDR